MPVQSETNKPELLAPAGGWEQLEYALHFGADAVYLACDRFGLRARASNFSLEDLPRAVELAHSAVRVCTLPAMPTPTMKTWRLFPNTLKPWKLRASMLPL